MLARHGPWSLVLAFVALAGTASAQERVSTCVHVESAAADGEGLAKLVASEVDRHPSHHVVGSGCSVHLKVELIAIGGERFVTGRIGGEVPDRVHVDGADARALERAVSELLRVVLGNDPVVLKAPGGQSWLGERALELRDRSQNKLDVLLLEGVSVFSGAAHFQPGVLVGFAREITSIEAGLEVAVFQRFDEHEGRLDLDTQIRVGAQVRYFFSPDADTSGFVGGTAGLTHLRFSGPQAVDVGGGSGSYAATGPGLGVRAGVELFRTTTTRAYALAEVYAPLFPARDQQSEIVSAWVPTLAVGAGVRF